MRVPDGCVCLRVLGTSDVHAHLRGFDYVRNVEEKAWGLTRLATRIAQARSEALASVLLDNGDILQGTPLAQVFSDTSNQAHHPVIEAMEAIGYDAIGLGNHEFNYGIDRLDEILSQTKIPVLCANVLSRKGNDVAEDQSLYPSTLMLDRTVTDPNTGTPVNLRVGVLSVVPTQIMKWDGAHLKDRVETRDMVQSAARHAAQLRADGADIVILLAHTGIDPNCVGSEAENAAVALAQIPSVDAMITGHTHQLFPSAAILGQGIDVAAGTVSGTPTVMPGYRGAYLGIIDLFLSRSGDAWRVEEHRSVVDRVEGAVEDPELKRIVEPAHKATLDYISRPLGETSRPILSYLSQVRDVLSTRLVAMAQKTTIARMLSNTASGHLPLLSASAPFQTGGRAGPFAYVDIPQGPLTMRDANSLCPYPNILCAVLATGAEIHDWLERSASAFCQVLTGQGAQPLLNPAFPGHAIDTIFGVTYRINLTTPALYDENGDRIAPAHATSRIVDLAYCGRPVRPDDQFVVALNGYRAHGGGPYMPFPRDRILVQTGSIALQSLSDFFASEGVDSVPDDPTWSFVPVLGATAVFETGPGVLRYKGDLDRLGIQNCGVTDAGFVRLCAPLDHGSCESAA
mgnify:FL=1